MEQWLDKATLEGGSCRKDNFISKKQEFQVKNILNNLICLKDILKTFTHEIQGRN